MTVKILPCKNKCKYTYQQTEYDEKRVHNQTTQGDKKVYRCTVCGTETNTGGDDKSASKKDKQETKTNTKKKK